MEENSEDNVTLFVYEAPSPKEQFTSALIGTAIGLGATAVVYGGVYGVVAAYNWGKSTLDKRRQKKSNSTKS